MTQRICGLIAAACLSHLLAGAVLAQTPPKPAVVPAAASGDIEPRVNTSAAPTKAPARPAARSAGRANVDRIELDNTQITGNRELPKVLYIVPWKRPELGDLVGRPLNSLLDEVLAPVDRDVFRRENRYFNALQTGSGGAVPAPTAAPAVPAAPAGPGSGAEAGSVPPSTPAPQPPKQPES